MHRKVHLFDIDIPGKIKFKVIRKYLANATESMLYLQESETLSGGSSTNFFDTGSLPQCQI